MGLGIPPLQTKILLESNPLEIQNLSTEIGRGAQELALGTAGSADRYFTKRWLGIAWTPRMRNQKRTSKGI